MPPTREGAALSSSASSGWALTGDHGSASVRRIRSSLLTVPLATPSLSLLHVVLVTAA